MFERDQVMGRQLPAGSDSVLRQRAGYEHPSNLHHAFLARLAPLHGGFVAGNRGTGALLSILAWWHLVRDQPLRLGRPAAGRHEEA